MDELLQIVDGAGHRIGAATRAACHRDPGLIHLSVCVLVFDRSGRLVLQRRSASKDMYPGQWDLSATGHVRAGERLDAAASRELREELGIRVELTRLTEVLVEAPFETELAVVYRCTHDGPFHPSPDEIGELAWVDLPAARDYDLTPFARAILDPIGGT